MAVDRHPVPIDRLDRRIDKRQRAAAATVPPGGRRAGREGLPLQPTTTSTGSFPQILIILDRAGQDGLRQTRNVVQSLPGGSVGNRGISRNRGAANLRSRHIDALFDRIHLIREIRLAQACIGER